MIARQLMFRLPTGVAAGAALAAAARPLALAPPSKWRAHFSASATAPGPVHAAIMVIGDEILSGSITDANTPWLSKLLHARGVDVVRVEYIPDDPADIAHTCQRLRQRVGPNGLVFTSGGIGPTHDDVTYESVAAALGLSLEQHAPTVARMQEHYTVRGLELNEARLRMATLPTPAEVLFTPGLWVPLVVAGGNVHILPGIPRLFQAMIEAHKGRFQGPKSYSQDVLTQQGEGDLAGPLAEVAKAHPSVRIGSYPNTDFDAFQGRGEQSLAYRVKIMFEGRDVEEVAAAVAAAREVIPTLEALQGTDSS